MSDALAYSLPGAAAAVGLSRSTIERAIKSGKLRAKKTDIDKDGNPVGSYVIPADSLRSWLEGLADA